MHCIHCNLIFNRVKRSSKHSRKMSSCASCSKLCNTLYNEITFLVAQYTGLVICCFFYHTISPTTAHNNISFFISSSSSCVILSVYLYNLINAYSTQSIHFFISLSLPEKRRLVKKRNKIKKEPIQTVIYK